MNSETRSGVLIATVFGSTSAKTIDQHRHDDGGVDDALVAEQAISTLVVNAEAPMVTML